jgi:hypothetical protein
VNTCTVLGEEVIYAFAREKFDPHLIFSGENSSCPNTCAGPVHGRVSWVVSWSFFMGRPGIITAFGNP